MSSIITPENKHFFVDRDALRKVIDTVEADIGLIKKPTMTPEQLQDYMMNTLGIRPEDNMASCGIIAARDEE